MSTHPAYTPKPRPDGVGVEGEVRRRETDGPAALIAVFDDARDCEPPIEEPGDLVEIASSHTIAHKRAGDGTASRVRSTRDLDDLDAGAMQERTELPPLQLGRLGGCAGEDRRADVETHDRLCDQLPDF
jgi:hypothetical protein